MKHLPPLRAIVAFEACYRLRSFTRAAASLNVRQPAISHQIRILEQDLGTRLFERQGARISPTGEADEFFLAVSSGLSEIVRGSTQIRSRAGDDTMSLATYPGIAAFWLLPRLATASAGAGKPPIRVTTAERDADIPLNDTDAAILFGRGDWPGFESILLVTEKVVPVASPALAEEWQGRSPRDLLRKGPLIHLEDPEGRWFDWDNWRDRHAPGVERMASAFTVTNHGIAIQEAMLGAGIALGWLGVIDDLLTRGALAALHDGPMMSDRGYYLVLGNHLRGTQRRTWLLDMLEVAPDAPGRLSR